MVFARLTVAATLLLVATSVLADDASPYKTATEKGVKTCLNQIKELGNFVVKKNSHASHDVWSSKRVDDRMFTSFVVKGYSDGDSHISMVVGPDKTGKCFAEYNETSFWPKSCSVIREEIFSDFKFDGSLKDSTIVLANKADSVNLYLTPQNGGNACLTTKREFIYY